MIDLFSDEHWLDVDERKETLQRICETKCVKRLLLDYVQNEKETKNKLKVLESLKIAYAHIVANRSINNLVYITAILSAIVSTTNGTSTNFISKTLGVTRYSLRKVIVRRVHVDEINENIWGGLPQKQHCDLLNEKDHGLILKWWSVATTISPIAKDVKRR